MPAAPRIETRAGQPYVAIRARVPDVELDGLGARFGEVFAWLGARRLTPAGAPFFRYNVIDMARELEVDAGVPVAAAVDGDGHVVSGVLPAGRWGGRLETYLTDPGEEPDMSKWVTELAFRLADQ
jgi:GyrI-like small molecule binding domain